MTDERESSEAGELEGEGGDEGEQEERKEGAAPVAELDVGCWGESWEADTWSYGGYVPSLVQ